MAKRQAEILKNRILKSDFYQRYSNTLAYSRYCQIYDSNQENPVLGQIQSILETEYENAFNSISPISLAREKDTFNNDLDYIKTRKKRKSLRDTTLRLVGVKPHELTLAFADDLSFFSEDEQSYFSGLFSMEIILEDWAFQEAIHRLTKSSEYLEINGDSHLERHYSDWYATLMVEDKNRYFSLFQAKYLGMEFAKITQPSFWMPTVITPNTNTCLLYTSPSPRDKRQSRMPSSA